MAMMAGDLSHALDPVLFARACGLEPDPWQANAVARAPATFAAALQSAIGQKHRHGIDGTVDRNIRGTGARRFVLAQANGKSAELFRTVMQFHAKLDSAPKLNAVSVLKAEMENGSRVLALPGTEKTVRGYAKADLVMIDEARPCRRRIDCCGSTNVGDLHWRWPADRLTTPAGKRGWFHDAWLGTKTGIGRACLRGTAREYHSNSSTRNCASWALNASPKNTA